MPTDTFFVEFEQRVLDLEAKFLQDELAKEIEDALCYESDTDMLAAYRMLAHAELEDYLERKARAELAALEANILASGSMTSDPRIYVLANHFDLRIPHECPFDDNRLKAATKMVVEAARDFLAENNGVKQRTLVAVALICGKSIDSIDASLCGALDSFGKERGEVAHKSAKRVTTIRAPSDEKTSVTEIVTAIKRFFYPDA